MNKTFTGLILLLALIVVFGCTDPVDPSAVFIAAIPGVTAPVYGATPVATITETDQYTGTVSWSPNDGTYAATTVYTATITLTAKTGFTFTGVGADFFTVAGATSVTNEANSGVVTAIFPATAAPSSGTIETYTADGVSFVMAYVPGGLTFPTGTNDDAGDATVADAYWIADTETTYELWEKVYTWATSGSGATGAGQYTFANAGTMGDGSDDTNQHPVTTVNWRDSMVWCNAFTEWYNAQSGTSYECVYTYSSAIIRDSSDTNATACDGAVASATADGFRLLTSDEYECAARYRDGTNWTYGDHASGDDSGACFDDGSILGGLSMSTVYGDYAWDGINSGASTHIVGTAGNGGGAARNGNANALGLYDLSGNVFEWCFDLSGSYRVLRGGNWDYSPYFLQVGNWNGVNPYVEGSVLGFRIAKNQ